jgi:hypothetical protein
MALWPTESRSARGIRGVVLATAIALCLAAGMGGSSASAAGEPVTLTDYTDPGQAMKFGYRSHWMQPWRSYLDTMPATALLNAVGINFNVQPKWASSTARLLADSGFNRARIEVGWGTLDYADPSRMAEYDRQNLVKTLTALSENGLRPLILLNANDGKPCPVKPDTVELTSLASAGDTEIQVAPGDVAKIAPGRTGITIGGVAAQILFTGATPSGSVQLSQPLPSDLPAGPLGVVTLRYEPFHPATLADGSPNPRFDSTANAWLNYVGVVTREVKSILGSDDFDVEVWNELGFGSRFLSINAYYRPAVEWRKTGNESALLSRTIAYLRDPANGVEGVGIGNGFANQSPWPNGSESPLGLTAIDKHPYAGLDSFPADAQINGNRPLNGLGEPAGWQDEAKQFHETFTPTYDSFFPERPLSGVHTESLVHDLAPQPSTFGGATHGRYTHPPGGDPPQIWVTEVNLGPGSGPIPRAELSAGDIRHIESKNVLRYLTSYVNKGVSAIDFYAANAGELSLVDQAFFNAVKANLSTFPGDALGGETTDAVRRLTASLQGAEPIASPRSLSLRELTDYSSNVQFDGNGTAAYPPLYNREVFGFFPFQVDPHRFVIPLYVMTRDVAKVYRPEAPGTDPTRFDLPAEPYRLAIGGVDGSGAQVSATDPLSGEAVPVEVISSSEDEIVVQMPVTDSPRLLTIQEQAAPSKDEEPELEDPAGETEEEPVEEPPAKDPAHGSPVGPSFQLHGDKALLRRRQLTVVARCETRCALDAHGTLRVGGSVYRMKPRQQEGAASAGSPNPTVTLSIGAKVAQLGRLALSKGSPVKLALTMRAQPESGAIQSAHRVIDLRR